MYFTQDILYLFVYHQTATIEKNSFVKFYLKTVRVNKMHFTL